MQSYKAAELTPIHDKTASAEQRGDPILDANCSHCHQPGGRAAMWDARFGNVASRKQ